MAPFGNENTGLKRGVSGCIRGVSADEGGHIQGDHCIRMDKFVHHEVFRVGNHWTGINFL